MFLLVDFLNIAYRNFFAIKVLANSKGFPTNAVYGFLQSVRRWMEECKPTHMAIVLDAETPKRRLELLPQYKANRPPTPQALPPQLEALNKLFPLLGWPTVYDPMEEADDLGASLALLAAQKGHEVWIASNDKDFFQIVGPHIKMLRSTPKKIELADEDWIKERWGIKPSQMVDFLALQGDSVDNIPGVAGVGEKTAVELIRRFGSVEKVLACLDKIERPKLCAALAESAKNLRRNLDLIRLNPVKNLPPLEHFCLQEPQYEPLLQMLSELEFKSLFMRYKDESQHTLKGPHQPMLFY